MGDPSFFIEKFLFINKIVVINENKNDQRRIKNFC